MAILPGTLSFHLAAKTATTTFLSDYSSLPHLKLQFPHQLRRNLGTVASPSHSRPLILPRIQATSHTFSSFEELIAKSDKPVLADFYAVWCGPCQFMVPILEQVEATLEGKIVVEKIDTDKDASMADKYDIEALPTFILFKNGEPVDRFEGALSADVLIKRIEAALAIEQ